MRQCGSRGSWTGAAPVNTTVVLQNKEIKYPFGVQNDLGHVQIPAQKNKTDIYGTGGRTSPATTTAGLASPPTLWRVAGQPHRHSTPSLQSTSLQCSLASSCDLTTDAVMLERAIRANDPLRVKRFLNAHHDKFQVNLHGSLLGKSSSDESQSQHVEILLRKSKTLIDRLEPCAAHRSISSVGSSCTSDSSSSSLSSGGAGEMPLVFSNALHLAVEYGSVDVLRLLLKYGLEPNQGGRVAGGLGDHPATRPPIQPSTPTTTTSPTHTSITGGCSEPSPGTAPPTGLPTAGRRVSWIGAKPERPRRRTTLRSALSRQRSFSLESNSELLRPWAGERRSVSLKSSPLVSPKPPAVASSVTSPAVAQVATSVVSPPPQQLPPQPIVSATPLESPKPQERSIFAELRRSSEIFKSILLNLSMKEQDSEENGLEQPSPASEPQIDVNELLAAHERLRCQEEDFYSTSSVPSSCVSSISSSDDDLETEVHMDQGPEIEAGSNLKVNPNLPPDKSASFSDIYTRPYLLTLPVLFLAVVRGNPSIVYLLLKYGAAVNFQDSHGNTPLHLAVARDSVPWDCVLELVECGSQVALANLRGVTAADMAPPGLLTSLQHNMINNSWPEPGVATASAPPPSGLIQQPQQGRGTPARILRKLRSNRGESGEEGSCASGGDTREVSSTGSARSSLNRSPDFSKENTDGKRKEGENRKLRGKRKWRESARERQPSSVSDKTAPPPDAERGFNILLQMSSNPEVLGFILRGLLAHISRLLKLLQQRNDPNLHRNMAALLHKLLKTSLETYGGPSLDTCSPDEASRRRNELSAACCLLLKTCLTLIHGVHDLQFTAMVTINKVIDTCVVYKLAHLKVKLSEALQHPSTKNETKNGNKELTAAPTEENGTKNNDNKKGRYGKTTKRLGSVWRHAAGEQLEQVRRTLAADTVEHEESVIEVLSSVHAMSVLNILHNALTLYKRVIGSKQQCTPSQRWRHCSYHCLQLLAARSLLFMVEGATVQQQLAQEPQLRILAAALDSTHDPQLLVLVLQIVATLALDPNNHRALADQGLPDVLSQLLLPSDEWYYTNHSTKYARYVKHHVARILVYLGFQHRVNLRFSVYDILQEDAPPPTPLMESVEDNYITNTSAPPSSVVCGQSKALLGISVESAVISVLKAIEATLTQGTAAEGSTLQWVLSGSSYYSHTLNIVQYQERKAPTDPVSSLFVQCFLSCYPCVLSPVILLRLLLHRLLTTAAHLQRWKSCTSRSSFASAATTAHEVPRSPRSRASSTDTEPSTLRNRRKVNLTVDCSGWGSDHGVENVRGHRALDRGGSLVPRDSIGSASGLEPAMQAIFAFSHILRTRSKESIHSGESSDGRLSPSDFRPLAAFNLHHHHKTRSSFRFSSLRQSNKQRSKSHANITKVLHHAEVVGTRETPEQEILAFQKQLQNLPDFDSPEGGQGGGGGTTTVTATGEPLERPALRPRSRSMPRVTYESSRFLTLPEVGWGKLPRGRSAGALGFQIEHHPPSVNMLPSPASTPVEERRVSSGTIQNTASVAGGNSRRSSLSPSDRTNRRRDSPACIQVEIPPWHRAILTFIEDWLRLSRLELERNPSLCKELRDLMSKVAPLGSPYQQWCAEFRQEFPVLTKDPDIENADDLEETEKEYYQLLQMVVGGDLPCSKEEAASLAGIQLRIEETWGRPQAPVSPDDNTLKTISEDKESFLLPVPSFGGNMARPVSPLVEEAETEEGEGKSTGGERTPQGPPAPQTTTVARAPSLLRKCYPSSTPQVPFLPSGHLEDCLPPCYHGTKAMAKLVKEQKRKLFHTSVYESEVQLKKLYIQTCRRLPAHGCKVYQVKELLRGKTKKKASRLLGLGNDRIVLLDSKTKILAKSQNTADLVQWQVCGGRSHDRLQLEFRGTRWSLVVPSVAAMRDVGLALWTILQDLDSHFLDEYALTKTPTTSVVKGRGLEVGDSSELEGLQRLLHFPEEVSLRLAVEEDALFYQVPPIDYLRQVTLDLGGSPPPPSSTGHHSGQHELPRASVRSLIKRFNEVSSWVTHLIISQPTHEDRKSVLSCILRVALSCWNIGNFNGAMEIVAGLKSNKLKPFWLSITEKEPVPVLDFLSAALLSVEYERALSRALSMPECRVVPFFGSFLRDLRDILSTTPSLVVLAPAGDRTHLEFISDYNGEDHYFTRIGPGGLINLDKIYKTQAVMDKIASFHQHYHARVRDIDTLREQFSIHTVSIERPYLQDETEDTENEMDSYKPVQPLGNDHGVSFFPISSPQSGLNHHVLQMLHHGSTAVHWDVEGGRSCLVFVRLERSCSLISWTRPAWSSLRTSGVQGPDYNLSANPEEGICGKWIGMGESSCTLEEGFLELAYVKEIALGPRDRERDPDLANILRRYVLDAYPASDVCLALVYGTNLSDNRVLFLLSPPTLCRLWYNGLCCVVRGLKRHLQSSDRRMFWLKEQYLQLFYEENCTGPMTVDAIKVFGGRDWASTGHITGMSPPDNGTLRRGASAKFKKKRSIGNIQTLRPESCRDVCEVASMGYIPKRTLPSPALPPSRSRSISSEMETRPGVSPQGSSDHLDSSSPTHHHRERVKKEAIWPVSHLRHGSITHETQLDFVDFVALFRSFSLRARKDLKDLFDLFSTSCRSMSDSSLNDGSLKSSPEHSGKAPKIGLLTRNSSADLLDYKNTPAMQKKKIFDAIATSSIVTNCAGVDTSKSQVIMLNNFAKFLETKQLEQHTEEEVKELIQRHEPDPTLRSHNCLSFEGFARFLMDKENFAFVNERVSPDERDMDYPISHYYIASSHNTYLTGHQLKGESSVDLYSQVLLSGCRCVELDCWDGDDGSPLIYHGHTFTTKIPFRSVVEAINRSAFVTSPYPVILSIENHCSLQQQARMAQIFQNVFGEKLVSKFIFESDFSDEPCLPSPGQLKYRILIKNKKLAADIAPAYPAVRGAGLVGKGRGGHQLPPTGRASSIISNTSGGSVNDDFSDDEDDEDDDDDENLDAAECPRTDSLSSHDSMLKTPSRSMGKPAVTQPSDIDWGLLEDEPNIHKAKKQSSQIARELSDLVIYIQAIKFRGLNTISPNSSVRCKRVAAVAAVTSSVMLKKGSGASLSGVAGGIGSPSSSDCHNYPKSRVNTYHPCYQCSSLNENSAKKLCRKQAHALIAHTETQLVRTYPAGMRIDSSNFNPVIFWAFGIQMVALNYQTEDAALHLNNAMFEQNGRCGYVPKPAVMRDRTHMMYRRFNPWDKEFDGLHSSQMILNIISGQYVCQSNLTASVFVEVELIGIQVDCVKQKTKVVQRNALNPIWNEPFYFQVMFTDLAFLRFSVIDANTNHLICQRVLPLKCLRPGYRHVRLRTPQNQPLQLSTLFVYSRTEEESVGQGEASGDRSKEESTAKQEMRPTGKRRMFFLMVYGVVPDEPYTILKITQESTTQEVVLQALQKTGQGSERVRDYVLVEEVSRGWDRKDREAPATQRVLDPQECPLQAQAQWQGEGKFLLKRMGDDPSSRAWLSSIRSTRVRQERTWDEADNFLVCVYNVSPEIPYAILKVPLSACAQDVLAQALVKARRMEDPTRFVLLEELEWGNERQQRVLPDDENIFRTQAHWQTIGRFILRERDIRRPGGNLRTVTLDRLSKGLSKLPVGEALSDPTAKVRFPLSSLSRSVRDSGSCRRQREVHSEGETLSDDDMTPDMRTAVSRLKRVSLRKLRVWKS
ncbi:uncharacterized protein isoform X2 [Rhodnius prolixus]|uniref:uncharacterized protein isoform X2 n=1 Tax=Rhodnius prolixus TaxID=13249 RepID=UPI003D18E5F0